MAELLTLHQISKTLGIPESSLRYYRGKFPEYIPSSGEGKTRRYHPEAVEVFSYIAQEIKKGKTTSDISEDISRRFTRFIDIRKTTSEESTTKSQNIEKTQVDSALQVLAIVNFMEIIATSLEKLSSSQTMIEKMMENEGAMREEISELREQLNERNNQMRDLIEKYEKENSEREERLLARDKAIDDFISTWRSAAGQEKKKPWWKFWRQV